MKKGLSVFLAAMLLLLMVCCPVLAEDVTESVSVHSSQHITITGNVTTTTGDAAICVRADDANAGDKSASVNANGNVSMESVLAFGVETRGDEGNASVTITGNVVADGGFLGYGVDAYSNNTNNGKTSVDIGGNVSAQAEIFASGIYATQYGTGTLNGSNTSVFVGGDVSAKITAENGAYATAVEVYDANVKVTGTAKAEGRDAIGVRDRTIGASKIEIGKDLSATGTYASGADLSTTGSLDAKTKQELKVGGSILATATGNDEHPEADGLVVSNAGGTITAEIVKDVIAKGAKENSTGILLVDWVEEIGDEGVRPGVNNILIHRDLLSDGVGICNAATYLPTTTNVLVEGTIDAKKVGILTRTSPFILVDDPTLLDNANQNVLNVTVWKIIPNADGNVAEFVLDTSMLPDSIAPEGVKTSGKDEDFEKNICYIIKLEQPKNGTKLKVVGEDGKALTKSFDFDVAKEGEKVYLDATLKEGYRITGAFNGDGDKIPLLKDEDGRYYIVVPKGGGVYLSVEQSNRYTVTLKDKNGTILQSTEVTYGTPISNLKDPVKAGKVFLGWYTDAALKNKLDPNAKITSDMQLYAKWGTASYPVSGGAKIVWKKGSGVNPTITINRKPDNKNCFKHFVALRIDGKLLRMGKDFFGKSGSTILTLQADMLETLALGNHTVTVEFDDGQVETALSIVAADSGKKSPKTGDAAQNGVWMMLAMLTAFGVAGVVLKKKTTDC